LDIVLPKVFLLRGPSAKKKAPNTPPADDVVAAQMRLLQQMDNVMTEMQAQIRQERQEMRQEMCQEW
jgi:hypothetical protein